MVNFSKWFFGVRYLITLSIVLLLLWIIIFSWFLIEEHKYGNDVVDKSGFARTYYEVEENGKIIKKFYANAFTDSIYFISTMFGTFGYGDIYPKTNSAKGLVTCMHFVIVIFIMSLYENVFVEDKTVKDLSLDIQGLTNKYELKNSRERAQSEPPTFNSNLAIMPGDQRTQRSHSAPNQPETSAFMIPDEESNNESTPKSTIISKIKNVVFPSTKYTRVDESNNSRSSF